IIPAAFASTYPALNALNVMHLATPQSAILSAVIFNALIIIALIPLALKGVAYRAVGAGALLRRNLLLYGVTGIIVPFVGIKLIAMRLVLFGRVGGEIRPCVRPCCELSIRRPPTSPTRARRRTTRSTTHRARRDRRQPASSRWFRRKPKRFRGKTNTHS